jgi:hypothetical protein
LRYNRSRFFTFLFFMQTLSGNGLNKFNKSCSALHQESSKIGVAFFRFLYNFSRISKSPLLLEILFSEQPPLEVSKLSQISPCFTLESLEKPQSLHSYPSAAGWACQRRWPVGPGQQMARDSLGAHLEVIGEVGRRGDGSGEGARRWPAVAAAAGCDSVEGGATPGNG